MKKIQIFMKKNGFYLMLLACIVFVSVIATVISNNNEEQIQLAKNKYIDLNENAQDMEVTEANSPDESDCLTVITDNDVSNVAIVENDKNELVITDKKEIIESIGKKDKKEKDVDKKEEDADEKQESTETKAEIVEVEEKIEIQPCFTIGKKMQWPIMGNIVMPFSMEKTIYHPTLEEYRTSNKISIKGTIGQQVKVSESGVVESITKTPEMGNVVVINHGDGWETTYGQLQNKVLVEENQKVNKGDIIGGIGTPSKYSICLGEHLDLILSKDNNPIDPEIYLP